MTEPAVEIGVEVGVVGVDFDDSGDDAIVDALRWLGQNSGRTLRALHVIDPDQVARENYVQPALLAKEQALTRAPQELIHWIAQLAQMRGLPFDERVHAHARIGKPIETMLQFATDYGASLVIVGTNSRRGLDRLLLGSVAESLVRQARCPVLVARPVDYTGAVKTQLPAPPYAPGEQPSYPAPARLLQRDIQTQSRLWQHSGGRPTGYRIV